MIRRSGHGLQAEDDVRHHEGGRRAALRLLQSEVTASTPEASGIRASSLPRDAARRRQTDYAVDIYWKAVEHGRYASPLAEGTRLPMMFMADALRAAIELMEADASRLRHSTASTWAR